MATIVDHLDPDHSSYRPLIRRLVITLKATQEGENVMVNEFLLDKVERTPSSRIRLYIRKLERDGYLTIDETMKAGWTMCATPKLREIKV